MGEEPFLSLPNFLIKCLFLFSLGTEDIRNFHFWKGVIGEGIATMFLVLSVLTGGTYGTGTAPAYGYALAFGFSVLTLVYVSVSIWSFSLYSQSPSVNYRHTKLKNLTGGI